MPRTIGCTAILLASCSGCCLLRIPTFGLGPEVDEAAVRQHLIDTPLLVDGLCKAEARCLAVEGAEVEVVPVAYDWLFGETQVLVGVDAWCTPVQSLQERVEAVVCKGILGGGVFPGASPGTHPYGRDVVPDGSAPPDVWLSPDVYLPTAPDSAHPTGAHGDGGGDWDWD